MRAFSNALVAQLEPEDVILLRRIVNLESYLGTFDYHDALAHDASFNRLQRLGLVEFTARMKEFSPNPGRIGSRTETIRVPGYDGQGRPEGSWLGTSMGEAMVSAVATEQSGDESQNGKSE